MENQQLRSLNRRIMLIARNAYFGDGTLWKHPECSNYKVVYTSTTPELLEAKMTICPEIFSTGVKYQDMTKHSANRYPNAKPLYRLASRVNPIITDIKNTPHSVLLESLTLEDFGLWYLDDGSTIPRTDSDYGYYRSYLYIGKACNTDEYTNIFLSRISDLFKTDNVGTVKRHTPFTSDNNKVWNIPVSIAKTILIEASKYNVLKHKFPEWIKFRDHSHGEVGSQGKENRSATIVSEETI